MFKKRMRLATVLFGMVLVATVVTGGAMAVTAKSNGVETKPSVYYGDVEEMEGVKLEVYTLEGIWLEDTERLLVRPEEPTIDTFHQIRTLTMTDGKLQKGLVYKNGDGTKIVGRTYEVNLNLSFSEEEKQGAYERTGSELSYDLTGEINNGFYRYFNVPKYEFQTWSVKDYITFAEEEYEYSPLHFDGEHKIYLSELGDGIYGYIGLEPVGFAEQSESLGTPEICVTVNKGIYRFLEDGATECVFRMGTLADDFSFLWMISKEEEKTFIIVGTKGMDAVAYVYSMERGTVEERLLWKTDGEAEAWYDRVASCSLADVCFHGDRVYLSYATATTGWLQVAMSVFENGKRVFEGELLKEKFGDYPLMDFSLSSNGENKRNSIPEKIKITVEQ